MGIARVEDDRTDYQDTDDSIQIRNILRAPEIIDCIPTVRNTNLNYWYSTRIDESLII